MSRRPPAEPDAALYVRLPADAVDRLHRAAEALGIAKKDLVAGLIAKHVDPSSKRGLTALAELGPRRVTVDMGGPTTTVGSYSFQPYDPPVPSEVMTPAQTAELLQLDEKIVLELAEAGDLPGRKLGPAWRFSRTAVLAWLAGGPR